MDNEATTIRKRLSLIVLTCDGRRSIVEMFFKAFRKHAPATLEEDVILVGETDNYMRENTILAGSGLSIKERFEVAVALVKTPYALILMDDYFLYKRWDNIPYLSKLLSEMDDRHLGYVNVSDQYKGKRVPGYSFCCELKSKDFYGISVQPSIWNISLFRRVLQTMPKGNPWEFEKAFWKNTETSNIIIQEGNPMHSKRTVFPCVNVITCGRILPHSGLILALQHLLPKDIRWLPLKSSVHFYVGRFLLRLSHKYREKIKQSL